MKSYAVMVAGEAAPGHCTHPRTSIMKSILYLLSIAAVAMYIYMALGPKEISETELTVYKLADVFMVLCIIGLLVTGHRSVVLIISLCWIVYNHFIHRDPKNASWEAMNGFTAAAVLSQIPM